jgi:uncharacterized protein (TIGR03435 family)
MPLHDPTYRVGGEEKAHLQHIRCFDKVAVTCVAVLIATLAWGSPEPGAPLAPGDAAPDFVLREVLNGPAEIRLKDLDGRVVLLDFWATWCAPCVAAIPHLNRLVEETTDLPFTVISISDEEPNRLQTFLEEHPMEGWSAVDPEGAVFRAYGVVSRPHSVLIGPGGLVRAVTYPSEIDRKTIEALLEGTEIAVEVKTSLPSDLEWDREQIRWLDGVQPSTYAIIKPIHTATGGYLHRPGDNRFVADGVTLHALVSATWELDPRQVDFRAPPPDDTYRVAARVPEGREDDLLPLLRRTIEATFGLETRRTTEVRPVYLLVHAADTHAPEPSASSTPEFWAMRGTVHGRGQPIERLVDFLTGFLGRPVVDQTRLDGLYDWELEYFAGDPDRLARSLREELGLELVEAEREVDVLQVELDTDRDTGVPGTPH